MKRSIASLLALNSLAFAQYALMGAHAETGGAGTSVVFDSTASTGASSSPVTFSIAIGSGSNRAIMIGCSYSTTALTGIAVTVGGVTANLVTGTTSSGQAYMTTIHALANPASGSQTVSVSWSGTSTTYCGAVSASGVDQITPAQNGTFAAGGPIGPSSVAITSATNNLTFSVMAAESGATPTAPTQTSRWAAAQSFTTGSGGSTAAGASSVTHQWATGSGWLASGADFKHA